MAFLSRFSPLLVPMRTIPSSSSSRFFSSSLSPAANLEIEQERVRIDKQNDGKIAVVSLNRPDKMNALDMPMFRSIVAAAQSLRNDKGVRVVVLRGEGDKAFCSGLDVKSVATNPKNFSELLVKPCGTPASNLVQDVGYLWRMLPIPVVAAIDGVCYGGGLQIALGADMRIASPTSKFSIMEAKWGLIPDMSITVTLPELVRADIARELTYTGRVIGAAEARDVGLVTRVTEDGETPDQRALQLAQEICEKNPDAVTLAKKLYREAYSKGGSALGEWEEVDGEEKRLLDLETDFQKRLLKGWNQKAKAAENFGVKLPYGERKN